MKETTYKLICNAITLACEKGFFRYTNIGTMSLCCGDPEMVYKVCRISNEIESLNTQPLLIFFAGMGIPIDTGKLEKNRNKMTPALAKMFATIINGYIEYFIACDDAYTQSFDFINYEESPEDILKAFEEIVGNLRTYH